MKSLNAHAGVSILHRAVNLNNLDTAPLQCIREADRAHRHTFSSQVRHEPLRQLFGIVSMAGVAALGVVRVVFASVVASLLLR